MAGKFEITQDKAGKYRFRLKAGNGEIIAVSEAYETKVSAKNGIESVKKNAPDAPVVTPPSSRTCRTGRFAWFETIAWPARSAPRTARR
jgi:uncharacterized protein YegP (UPF0339 family)